MRNTKQYQAELTRLVKVGEFSKAARVLDSFLKDLNPQLNYEQLVLGSNIYLNDGQFQKALQFAQDAVRLNPNRDEAIHQAFWTLVGSHEFGAAGEMLDGLIARKSSLINSDYYYRWKVLLESQKGNFQFVIDEFDSGRLDISIEKHRGEDLLSALVLALPRIHREQEALELLGNLSPGIVKKSTNLSFAYARVLHFCGDAEKASEVYLNLFQKKNHLESQWNRSLVLLAEGKLREGWRAHEIRWQWKDFPSLQREFSIPRWNGEQLQGKDLLVWPEQGIGDEIMFLSKLPTALEMSPRRLLVEVSPKLVPLVERWYPEIEVLPSHGKKDCRDLEIYSGIDYQIPSGSISLIEQEHAISGGRKFLDVSSEAETLRSHMNLERPIKVGLMWRSSVYTADRSNNYLNYLAAMELMIHAPHSIEFVLLQYKLTDEETAALEPLDNIYLPKVDLYDDVLCAAVHVNSCDMVITPATIMMQLAGLTQTPCVGWGADNHWSYLGSQNYPWWPNINVIRCQRNWDKETLVLRLKAVIDRLPSLMPN